MIGLHRQALQPAGGELDVDESSRFAGSAPQDVRLSSVTKWALRVSALALIGPAIQLHFIYLAPKFSVQHVLYGAAALFIVLSCVVGRIPRLSKTFLLILVWLVCGMCVALLLGRESSLVLEFTIKSVMYLTAAGVCGMVLSNSLASLRAFSKLGVAAATLNAALAILQAATGQFFFLARDERAAEVAASTGRAFGFFANPNDFASYQLIPFALCLAAALHAPHRKVRASVVWWVLTSLCALSILASASRSAVAAMVLAAILVPRVRSLGPKHLLGLIGSGVLMLGIALLLMGDHVATSIDRLMVGTRDEARRELASIAWRAFLQSPVFGSGVMSFAERSGGIPAHNGVLEPLAELGLFGGTAVFAGLIGGVLTLWWSVRRSIGMPSYWLWRGWAAGATGLLLTSAVHGSAWRSMLIWSTAAVGFHSLLLVRASARGGSFPTPHDAEEFY